MTPQDTKVDEHRISNYFKIKAFFIIILLFFENDWMNDLKMKIFFFKSLEII